MPHIGFALQTSSIKKIRRREQGGCRCIIAGPGSHSVVANRAQMCTADHAIPRYSDRGWTRRKNRTADCQEENNRTMDCHSHESKFESALPSGYSCCRKPRHIWERFAKEVIPVTANRGTLDSGLPRAYSCCGKTAVLEHGLSQQTETQYQPLYIDSPLYVSCYIIYFRRATWQSLTL
jgi:hypothetical protein